MKNKVSIEEMGKDILTLLQDSKSGMSQPTVREYELSFGIILSHLNSQGVFLYDKEAVAATCRKLCEDGSLSKTRSTHFHAALNNLEYYFKHHTLQPRNGSRAKLECMNAESGQIVSDYLGYCQHMLSIKKGTIRVKRVYDIHFMNYLALRKIHLSEIDGNTVMEYLVTADKKDEWTERTKNANLYEIRRFLSYLVDNHGVSHGALSPVHVIFGCHKKSLPTYYEPAEVRKMINNIDVSSPKGKRDYLVCLLVAQLGMRAGDVSRLKYQSIHWDRETIEIIQQKTGNPLVLPLLANLRFALLDYWKNARPESDVDTILLTLSKPHRCLAPSFLSRIVTGRLEKAGIDIHNRRHGCHAMRHSLARNLLSDNEALSTITGILGHENSNTTRRYLSIDTKGLRFIALEVPYDR